jgi:hypothetical protein
METYVSPAWTLEPLVDDRGLSWMPFNWISVVANVMITVGMTIQNPK